MGANRISQTVRGFGSSSLPGRRAGRGFVAILLAALTLGLGQAPASADPTPDPAATGLGCGLVLLTSATLTEDLTCSGDGLIIGADNVTINLNGHTIRGDGSGAGIQAGDHQVPRTGITVRNGRIEGFFQSIALYLATNVTITNVTTVGGKIDANIGTSGTISGSRARCVLDGFQTVLSRWTVDRCALHGITVFNQSAVTLTSSRLTSGRLQFAQSDNSTVTGNVFDDFPATLGFESRNNTLRDNVFKNTDTAMWLSGTSVGNTVENNTFKDNSVGINAYIFSDKVTGNRFVDNRTAGLYIRDTIATASVTGNTFRRNGGAPDGLTDPSGTPVRGGIHIGLSAASTINVAGNSGSRNQGYFIFARPGTVVDGGANKGRPCGPQPTPAVTCG
ncbi:right-handed parallel beta-helix repeat-containing protein [Sphaerisporangium sp. NPDC051017]|uniref:right-handed parallel beta-helix repeat-containing protein n=1 Tax=Sphaerisporangium sp. NPDC051017 TaxID=3154636 RepID=UPI00341D2A9C